MFLLTLNFNSNLICTLFIMYNSNDILFISNKGIKSIIYVSIHQSDTWI